MTNITTLRHFAAHAHTDEQRAAAADLMAQFDDTMGLSPVQEQRGHFPQWSLDFASVVLLLAMGWLSGVITVVMVLT